MILWLFYGQNFKEKFEGSHGFFEVQNSEEFRRNPTRRNETTRVRFLTLNPISFLVKIHDFRIYLSMW